MTALRPAEVILEAVDRFGEDRLALAARGRRRPPCWSTSCGATRRARASSRSTPASCSRRPTRRGGGRGALRHHRRVLPRRVGARACGRRTPTAAASCARSSRSTRALADADCWISGVRRDQSPDRAPTEELDWDERHGLLEGEPARDLDRARRLGLHRGARPPLQPAARPGLRRRSAARTARSRAPAARAAGPGSRRPSAGSTCRSRAERRRAKVVGVKSADTRWHDGAVTRRRSRRRARLQRRDGLVDRPAGVRQVDARGRASRRCWSAPAGRRCGSTATTCATGSTATSASAPRTAPRTSAAPRTPRRCWPRPASSRSSRSSRPTPPTAPPRARSTRRPGCRSSRSGSRRRSRSASGATRRACTPAPARASCPG